MQLDSYDKLRRVMLFWAYFIGLGALLGTVMFFIDPSGVMWGMEPLLPILKARLPIFDGLFHNFTASGIALLMIVGVPNIVSVVLTHKRSRYVVASNMISAVLLVLWILLEFYIWGALALSVAYYIFGTLQLVTATSFKIYQRHKIK